MSERIPAHVHGNGTRDRHLRSREFFAARTEVDRVALGVRGAPGMVPRTVEVDVRIVLRRGEQRAVR
jgi:hypothetical protein